MESRISLITLGVSDLERSLVFYRDGLGLPTTWTADKGVIFLKTSGTRLALYPYANLTRDISPEWEHPRSRFSGITLAHNVRTKEEVDAILLQAELAGGKIERGGHETFWGGYGGYFSDPDGYVWEVAWGAFGFLEDGALDIP